ncbi:sporulation protein YunB [Clostridium isatidis]|uniref:Sporulation protein YunB n=1 Tax=Clostridium isatidis TaxID=182773 RepID=A0A343JAG6_9CLOT|nr:sporulation protein YunB [Clostridium isatidis]ASW42524.1 sporulation protein YunB [Clostridium isatidis]NLZ35437.1 sporulation protein YunB [Clostridiales bacterium]
MKYYRKPHRIPFKVKNIKFIIIIISLCIIINSIISFFHNNISPAVIKIAEDKLKNEATNIVYENALDIYSKEFDYSDIMSIEKDSEGNITLLRADTVKLNYLSSKLILTINNRITELENLGIEVPLGYMTKNLAIHKLGPKVNIDLEQIGNINTKYESIFESAGINQTRHKIYLNVSMKMRVVIPLNSKEVEISCQIPISETIVVGKIPNTAIEFSK